MVDLMSTWGEACRLEFAEGGMLAIGLGVESIVVPIVLPVVVPVVVPIVVPIIHTHRRTHHSPPTPLRRTHPIHSGLNAEERTEVMAGILMGLDYLHQLKVRLFRSA